MQDPSVSIHGIWFVAVLAAIIAAVIVVVIRQLGADRRERTRQGHAEAYRRLADEVLTVQSRAGKDLGRLASDIEDIKTRLASVERMMRQLD